MATELLLNFANDLSSKRKNEGISIQQIHQKTRIEVKFIEAIEKANFDIMPELYMRAFIKEYAETIGLKGEDILKKYDLAKSGKTQETVETITQTQVQEKPLQAIQYDSTPNETKDTPTKKVVVNKNFIYAVSSGALIVIAAFLYVLLFENAPKEIIKETPYEEILQENKERFEIKKEPESPLVNLSPDSLYLKVVTNARVWIKVKIDDSLSTDFTSQAGETHLYAASTKFYVVLGNAGGVNLFLNEVPLKIDALSGSVRTLEIDKDGVKSIKPVNTSKPALNDAPGN